MQRRAVLIFADNLGVDLARRGLPCAARDLFRSHEQAARVSGADVHLFTTWTAAGGSRVHAQSGVGFGERLENAIETLAARGYEEIVAIGRDCPELSAADVSCAFAQLAGKRLVLGPDHRGGCYLIALRSSDRDLVRGIRWKRNTDCAQLGDRCDAGEVFLLRVKQDVDSWADLKLLARGGDRLGQIAARLLRSSSGFAHSLNGFVDLAAAHLRVRWQMPPPRLAS